MKAKFKASFSYGDGGGNYIILEADSNTPLKALFENNIKKYNEEYKNGVPSKRLGPHEIPETAKAVSAQVNSSFVKKLGVVTAKCHAVKLTTTTTLRDVLNSVQGENSAVGITDLNEYPLTADASIFVKFK